MGKKRKAGEPRSATELQQEHARSVQTTYDVDERFADSEDEFFAERDKILLKDGPASKRRRRLDEQGELFPAFWDISSG